MKRSVLAAIAAMAVTGTLLFAACGGGGDEASGTTQGTGTAGTASTGSAGGTGSGGNLFGDGGVDDVVSIVITPQAPVIEVLDGVIPAATVFSAIGTTT